MSQMVLSLSVMVLWGSELFTKAVLFFFFTILSFCKSELNDLVAKVQY